MPDNPKQIRIPPLTWKRVRRAALDLDMSASEFVRRAVVCALFNFDQTGELPEANRSVGNSTLEYTVISPSKP